MATYTYNVSHTSPPGPRVLKFVGAGTGTGSSVVSVTIDGRPFYSGELSWNAPGDVRYVKLGHAIGVVSVTTENTKADGDLIACSGVYTYPETNLPLITQDSSANAVSQSPIVAPTAKAVTVQRRLDAVVKNIEQSGYGSVHNSADRTFQHNAVVLPCSGGGYTLLNWSATTLDIVSLRLALAPTPTHDGTGLTWVNATFSGSAGATIPGSTADSSNNRVPGAITCDPVTFPADVARTDDPTSPYRVIVARIETSAAWTLQNNDIGDGRAQNTAHECQEYFGAVSNTGGFTGAVSVSDGSTTWYLWLPGFFSITPRASVPSIQTHGDSIMRQDWLFAAQKTLASEGIRFPVASSAAGQSNKASSYARFLAERGIGRSSMYLWQSYSPNDSADTLVCIANGYKYTRLVLADLWANNITPIIVHFPTVGANNAAKQAAWVGMRDWLTSLDAAKKIHFLDTSALSNPATPWFYLPAMTGDGTHLSAEGVAVCAAALAKVIRMHV